MTTDPIRLGVLVRDCLRGPISVTFYHGQPPTGPLTIVPLLRVLKEPAKASSTYRGTWEASMWPGEWRPHQVLLSLPACPALANASLDEIGDLAGLVASAAVRPPAAGGTLHVWLLPIHDMSYHYRADLAY